MNRASEYLSRYATPKIMGGKNRRYAINGVSQIRISKSYCADMKNLSLWNPLVIRKNMIEQTRFRKRCLLFAGLLGTLNYPLHA